jgi:hypothetical protein
VIDQGLPAPWLQAQVQPKPTDRKVWIFDRYEAMSDIRISCTYKLKSHDRAWLLI